MSLKAWADSAIEAARLRQLLFAHHQAGVLPELLSGKPCPICEADGYFRDYPEPSQWQPVTSGGTR